MRGLVGGGRGAGARALPARVYTARTPFSEPLVQVLLFGGLCLFTDSLVVRGGSRRALGGGGVGPGDGTGAGRVWRARARAHRAGLHRLARHAAARVPGARGAVRGAAPAGGPVRQGLFLGIGIGLAAGLVLARAYLSTLSTSCT